mmetsp:Transcript_60527/g.119953  ORF Transcript_60527/g.119953 Transcript_60527/m.119953 type:complete len:182 (+) Transcript_60527:1029-1574(+)
MTPGPWIRRPDFGRRKRPRHAVEHNVTSNAEATAAIAVTAVATTTVLLSLLVLLFSLLLLPCCHHYGVPFFASTAIVAARDCQRRRGCAKRPASSVAVCTASVPQDAAYAATLTKPLFICRLWLHACEEFSIRQLNAAVSAAESAAAIAAVAAAAGQTGSHSTTDRCKQCSPARSRAMLML